MQQHSLAYKSSVINYYVFGSGAKTLFCFHGYDEDGLSFAFLEKLFGVKYTLYALDFPFHGKTQWNEKEPFTLADLVTVLQLIHPFGNMKFSLLAYSMGGRAALHLIQETPTQIERVALVAPDGLHQNIWYWLTTQTSVGNNLFAYTMKKPQWFFSAADAAGKLKLLNKSILKFVHYYLDDREQRALLYKRWTFMRKLKPNLPAIKQSCIEKNIQLGFLFGEFDRIILSKRALVFRNTKNIHIKVINAGHQLMKEKYANEIAALLNH
ncbi:MAG TPA: alpha/beta hydrolase [Parafilimonas sp.]|nr:alpha/beta hydrolase [Parafilimonas sp.]